MKTTIPAIHNTDKIPVNKKNKMPQLFSIPSQKSAYCLLFTNAQILCKWNKPKKINNTGSNQNIFELNFNIFAFLGFTLLK
jgi:hypothetical protein